MTRDYVIQLGECGLATRYFKMNTLNTGSHQFWRKRICEILVLTILIGSPIISGSEYESSILSLTRPPSSTRPSQLLMRTNDIRYAENNLYLEDFPNNAAVLRMTRESSSIKSEELLELLGGDSPNAGFVPFKVTPPEGYGIMAVIQELQIPADNTFNRSLLIVDDNGRIVKCFSKFVFQIEGKSPVEVCGRINDQSPIQRSVIDGVGPRSFVVPVGKSISVGFVYRDEEISSSPSLSKQVPFYDVGYIFRASIAFTAYKVCPHGPPFFNENNEKLWPCDIPQSSREAVAACIREDLFCDNIIHCGMHDAKEFAVDEKFCKDKVAATNDSNSSSNGSPRGKRIRVDTLRLEEAIRNRVLSTNRPFNYNDGIIPMGPHSGKGSHYTTEPMEKVDTLSHPAFVALIILITIICLLIIGLIFRYCCRPCVGKSDPFGDSSNPEAVARFHENLRNRDNDISGQHGRSYGVSFDNIFKPTDDLPPSYTDLFPQDLTDSASNHKSYNISTSSPVINSNSEDTSDRSSDYPPPSVYSVPVSLVTQETSRSINANGSQQYFLNPAFVHVEVLPGNNEITPLGRRNDPISVTINSDDDHLQRPSHQNHHAYGVDST